MTTKYPAARGARTGGLERAGAPLKRTEGFRQDGANRSCALNVSAVRYIKLGEGGKWAAQALRQAILPFGYRAVDHDACVIGDWKKVRQQLIAMGRKNGGIGQGIRELKEFYERGEDTLWFTLADGHLWWTFAEARVIEGDENDHDAPSRFRRTLGGWRSSSLAGVPLNVRGLSSALTSTANYQMTVCAVKQADYLLRRIRGESEPLRTKAGTLISDLEATAQDMIRRLDWRDFETLIDLIFCRGGWHRISQLGGGQSDVDLLLRQPITGETAWVQVKSRSSQAEFEDYLARFRRDGSCDRFFFVYHSAAQPIKLRAMPKVQLWSAAEVATAAIDGGLARWLSSKTV
jgi:hypothetical protein